MLCGWISAVLEGRHTRQDELFTYVDQNLSLVVDGLKGSAGDYAAVDEANANLLRSVHGVASQVAAAVVKWVGRILTYTIGLINSLQTSPC